MNEILLLGLLSVGVVLCEIVSSKQRAETANKIDEIHGWMRRQHPYRYTDFSTSEDKNNEVNDTDHETDREKSSR